MNYFIRMFVILFLLKFNFIQAQAFQGIATYEVKLIDATLPTIEGSKNEEEKNKALSEAMKVLISKKRTFILKFNKTESVYQEEEYLSLPQAPAKGMVVKMVSTGFGKTYKNLIQKQEIIEREILNKEFLVTEPLALIDWKLESEAKIIGDFTCYKATAIFPVSEHEKEVHSKLMFEKEQNNSIFFNENAPEPKKITVWYTPEIPVNHGPNDLWGLPGLILEVNDGSIITLCSKIILNTKDNMEIKAPSRGTVISQNAFDELETKKMQEQKNNNK